MAITNMKRCYFRPTTDWSDSESESSAASYNKHFNMCAEEHVLLNHTTETEASVMQ